MKREAPAGVPKQGTAEAVLEAQETEEATQEPVVRLATVSTAQGLNLRAGPGKKHKVLAVLPGGFHVELLDLFAGNADELFELKVPGWVLVHAKDWLGRVNEQFPLVPEIL